jgi:hypothetical protein
MQYLFIHNRNKTKDLILKYSFIFSFKVIDKKYKKNDAQLYIHLVSKINSYEKKDSK